MRRNVRARRLASASCSRERRLSRLRRLRRAPLSLRGAGPSILQHQHLCLLRALRVTRWCRHKGRLPGIGGSAPRRAPLRSHAALARGLHDQSFLRLPLPGLQGARLLRWMRPRGAALADVRTLRDQHVLLLITCAHGLSLLLMRLELATCTSRRLLLARQNLLFEYVSLDGRLLRKKRDD